MLIGLFINSTTIFTIYRLLLLLLNIIIIADHLMKMNYLRSSLFFTLLIVFFVSPALNAQVSMGGEPYSWQNNLEITRITMPPVNVSALKAEDQEDQLMKDIPFRFAFGHTVNMNTNNCGNWTILANGDRVWMLEIVSKGALSINLTFSEYYLPKGAKLFIYSPDETYKIGALTDFNNKPHIQLGTAPIPGDKIIIEYFEPADVDFQGVLTIGTVAHAYRDIFKLAEKFEKGFGDSGDCNNNVVCPEAEIWENQIRSVALITLGNGTRFCSGSLLNNVTNDETPYFLTANHCIEGQTVSTMVFIFNYQSDICDPGGDGNDGELTQSVSGATLLENTNTPGPGNSTDPMDTDMAFLLLSESPPSDYNVFYSGWDNSGVIPASTVGIHHPSGDVKKISFDEDAAQITGYFDLTGNGGGTTYWRIVNWEDGTTEGGSSGSSLFNDNRQIIGQLHGGQASCSNNVNDYYGRLALSYQFIAEWLDPNNTGVTSILGWPEPGTSPIDPGLHPIEGIELSYCEGTPVLPTVVIENYGTNTLLELDLNYYLNDNIIGIYHWTGSLETFETDEVAFGEISVSNAGISIFKVDFEKQGDVNLGNNTRSQDFYYITNGIDIEVNLLTDSFAVETSWSIFTKDGYKLAENGPLTDNTLYKEIKCVPDECIEFVIYDTYGDGLCCEFGNGKYSLTLRDSAVVMASGAEFEFEESNEICVQNFHENIGPDDIIKVYPNPTLGKLNIDFVKKDLGEVIIRMYNYVGQEIFELTYNQPSEAVLIDLVEFSSGMYILKVSDGDSKQSQKIIIQ